MSEGMEETLLRALSEIRAGTYADATLAARLRESFLAVGSRTPENRRCMQLLDVASVTRSSEPRHVLGIVVKERRALVADILSAAEGGEELPERVRQAYPDLSASEWNACLRFVVVLMTVFEKPMD